MTQEDAMAATINALKAPDSKLAREIAELVQRGEDRGRAYHAAGYHDYSRWP